jgi:hypothetical protein
MNVYTLLSGKYELKHGTNPNGTCETNSSLSEEKKVKLLLYVCQQYYWRWFLGIWKISKFQNKDCPKVFVAVNVQMKRWVTRKEWNVFWYANCRKVGIRQCGIVNVGLVLLGALRNAKFVTIELRQSFWCLNCRKVKNRVPISSQPSMSRKRSAKSGKFLNFLQMNQIQCSRRSETVKTFECRYAP